MARHDSNTIIKFADDTTVVDLITDNEETKQMIILLSAVVEILVQ